MDAKKFKKREKKILILTKKFEKKGEKNPFFETIRILTKL